jgi:hypothetical protein
LAAFRHAVEGLGVLGREGGPALFGEMVGGIDFAAVVHDDLGVWVDDSFGSGDCCGDNGGVRVQCLIVVWSEGDGG